MSQHHLKSLDKEAMPGQEDTRSMCFSKDQSAITIQTLLSKLSEREIKVTIIQSHAMDKLKIIIA